MAICAGGSGAAAELFAAEPVLRAGPERGDLCPGAAEHLEAPAHESAVLEERNRIAREIHDTLAQGLAAIRLQLELARDTDELPAGASQAIELAQQIANENFVDARRLISALRSSPPCLATALSASIERARRLGPARIVTSFQPVSAPPSEVTHELLRIAQEAIQNAEHHARARTITVTLEALPGRGLRMTVADDGQGFDARSPVRGFGLAGMQERAAAVQADLDIDAAPGAGARVTVTWSPG
jgi:two-component system NarL family sensor kinase